MKVSKIILFALLIFSLHVKSQEFKTLDDSTYTVNYPKKWSLDKSNAYLKFILFSPEDNTVFRENVNLIIQNLSDKNTDLAAYASISEKQITTMIPGAVILESKTLTKDDGDYYSISYEAKQGAYFLKWKQYYWVKGNRAYVLTFTSDKNSYDLLIKDADLIMNSFKLK